MKAANRETVSRAKLALGILLATAGFLAAVAVNLAVPQIADVKIVEYELGGAPLGGAALDFNALYRLVVGGIAVIFLATGAISFYNEESRAKYIERAPFRFALGVALAAWDILGTKLQLLPVPFFPGPAKILETFLIEPKFVLENTLYSLRLYAAGFTVGSLFGVATGIVIGWFPKVYYWVAPILKTSGVIPAVAWMPFALTLAPTPFLAAVFLMTICAWFPIASFTAQGVQSAAKAHFEAAKTLGANTAQLVPHAMPQIFGGIAMANGFMFTTLVMSEMMGQPGGLGYYIQLSRVWSAYYKVFAAIVVMAALFSVILSVISAVQSRVLRWQKGLVR